MREFTKLSHGSIGFSFDQRDLESRRACDRLPLPETWPAIFVDRFEIATRSAFALPAIFVFCEGVVPGATFFAATVFVVGLTAVEETGSGAMVTRLAARVAAVLVKTWWRTWWMAWPSFWWQPSWLQVLLRLARLLRRELLWQPPS